MTVKLCLGVSKYFVSEHPDSCGDHVCGPWRRGAGSPALITALVFMKGGTEASAAALNHPPALGSWVKGLNILAETSRGPAVLRSLIKH